MRSARTTPPALLPVTPLLLLALVLSGCSGSADPDSPSPETSAATPAPSATPSLSAEPEAAPVLDPCDMVPEATWQRFVPQRLRSRVVLTARFMRHDGILIDNDRTRYACQLTIGGEDEDASISWGYFPGIFETEDLEAMVQDAGGTVIDTLGFPALTTSDFTSSDAYAVDGTTGLFVTAYEAFDSIISGEGRASRTKDKDLLAVITALGASLDATVEQPKVALPESCPAADSPEIAAAYGPVTFARGGERDGHEWCLYRTPKQESDLTLDARHYTEDDFEQVYAANKFNPHGVELLDGPPGLIRMVSIGQDGSGNAAVLDPEAHLTVSADISNWPGGSRRMKRGTFIALATSYAEGRAAAHADDQSQP
ncbi:hypothetical protein [Nocardioides sp. LHG3406-4]|uniref:hypothetical protein n=1 Tax=Nocardioides sp. LHG3406-4 TaxID=2804575 RepID=UPI003CF9CEBB